MEVKIQELLKALYKAQNTIPKLIEDESIPEQSMDEYYVKLQNILHDSKGENKTPIELSELFSEVKNLSDDFNIKQDINKILITGIAGIGKTTLLNYGTVNKII